MPTPIPGKFVVDDDGVRRPVMGDESQSGTTPVAETTADPQTENPAAAQPGAAKPTKPRRKP